MGALNLAQVLWEERRALAGTPLAFPPKKEDDPAAKAAPVPATPAPKPSPTPAYLLTGAAPLPSADGSPGSLSPPTAAAPDLLTVYQTLNADDRWALCLSGGGIRSAAFALGILQRIAALDVTSKRKDEERGSALRQFEYLSTVSGGGYIGSWLSAWLYQQRKLLPRGAAAKTTGTGHGSTPDSVVSALNERDSRGPLGDHEEAEPISNLRRNSHFLSPSFSSLSPDLWSDVASVLRNLFLNWILLVPPMILAVLVTKALYFALIDAHGIKDSSIWFLVVMTIPTLCLLVSLSFSVANRPARGWINVSQSGFLLCDLAPFLVGAALLVLVLQSPYGLQTLTDLLRASGFEFIEKFNKEHPIAAVLIRGTILGMIFFAVSWVLAPLWTLIFGKSSRPPLEARPKHPVLEPVAWVVAGAAFGLLSAMGLIALWKVNPSDSAATAAGFACVLGLPWIVLARIVAEVTYIAFAEFLSEVDVGLEFQARSSGLFTLAYLGWLLWFGIVVGAPPAARWIASHLGEATVPTLAAGGGLSGLLSILLGASSKTKAAAEQISGLRQYLSLNTLAAIAAAIFAIVLVALLSIGWDAAFKSFASGADGHMPWTIMLVVGVLLGGLIYAASHVLSINRYSLHGLYRNRLVRAFLGASRSEKERDKTKNAFTDFDGRDSPLLQELWDHNVKPTGAHWKPLHVISGALNLVSSKNLAWQERMAAPFTFSPLHCGSGSAVFSDGAYRTTYATDNQPQPYGGNLTLGTAMAISGAAVSPSMGYNSSPGVAFLMALFNVRLGWWLANPRGDNPYYSAVKPTNALRPFFMEMFGLTSETERWVYLTDGGHFENLGLYEMVRRRCRVIVVSDAGCDPDYSFEDLGNALRKVWIDLGVRIDLHGLDLLKKRFKERPTPAEQAPYWAIGDIRYSEADGGDAKDGLLLYFKSGLHGTEPMGVLSYAIAHATFPHESTLNQFFSESQFESYRALGYEIAQRAFESGGGLSADAKTGAPPTFLSIVEKLKGQLPGRTDSVPAPGVQA
ncbi:patatin-like phospholipase family protein [Bradyrhizobium stylosanthis]|uniref:Patatin-like phospholipase n=1 Tax=Bradyrhizobium stylosanthis TaxID=1803665 RepID=A0A560DS31_9BRAD|nr:patatin-like phospholipase family protein [Bradyrhizobium stylosanthis]TWA99862.1 patatin-like phospholipase [Bradyrhizobium stylosanthis]